MARRGQRLIDLDRLVDLLHTYLTPALCRAAFGQVRINERQRAWTLTLLVQFWIAIVLYAPKALRQALAEAREEPASMYPAVPATPEAFFQRCQRLRPAFFAEVFRRFTGALLGAVPPRYAADLAPVRARFAALVVIDGSRVAAIARRLKLLWDERAVVLPGCLLGIYDLGHGLCRTLAFDPDAAASEFTRAVAALKTLPRDTLVLADRLYGTTAFFASLQEHQCWGLVRVRRQMTLHRVQRLGKRRRWGGCLEDWLVEAGTGRATAPAQQLRYIRWRGPGGRYEVLTNVLTPTRLPAEEALALYPYRWSIERMFFDLKVVLNLNRLYAANPNPVAMHVYAAAIVYNGLRVAQSEGAAQVGCRPKRFRRPSSSRASRWRRSSPCSNNGGNTTSDVGAVTPTSVVVVTVPRSSRSKSSIAPSIAAVGASAPPGVGGNPSRMFAVAAAFWRNYLNGDDGQRPANELSSARLELSQSQLRDGSKDCYPRPRSWTHHGRAGTRTPSGGRTMGGASTRGRVRRAL